MEWDKNIWRNNGWKLFKFGERAKFTCSRSSVREFPGGPVVRLCAFTAEGTGSTPGRGTKILQAVQRGQKKKKFCEPQRL